jgi:small subunit ribosomal protein S8e
MGRQPSHTGIGEKALRRVRVRGGNFKIRALRLDHGNFSWTGEAIARTTRILKVVYNATSNELVRTNTLVKSAIVQIDASPFKAWYKKYYNVTPGEAQLTDAEKLALKDKKAQAAKDKKSTEKGRKAAKTKEKEQKKFNEHTESLKQYKRRVKAMKIAKRVADKANKEAAAATTGKQKGKKEKEVPLILPAKVKKAPKPNRPDPNSKSYKERMSKRNKTRVLEPALEEQLKSNKVYARITSRPGQVGRADGVILEGEELAFYIRKINIKKKHVH